MGHAALDAHARTGRRDRDPCEDHRWHLDALHGIVRRHVGAPEPLDVSVLPRVAGDGPRLSDHDGLVVPPSIST